MYVGIGFEPWYKLAITESLSVWQYKYPQCLEEKGVYLCMSITALTMSAQAHEIL